MLTENQLKILDVFLTNIYREVSLPEIKSKAKVKSNNYLQFTIESMKKENLVTTKKVGNSWVLKLNLDNDRLYDYISIINSNKMTERARYAIGVMESEIEKVTPFFSIVVFGSYASGENKKDSDLDVAIFTDSGAEEVQQAVYSAKYEFTLELDAHIINAKDFAAMIRIDEENLGKEIARNHLAVTNPKIFYSLLRKAVETNFKM